MLVAGWADGYRNSTFRTVARFAAQGTPHRLLAGPWAHADPTTAMPGPRLDFDAELAGWFDHWLRGRGRTPTAATSSSARPPARSRTSTCTRGTGCACRRCRPRRPTSGCCRPAPSTVAADTGTAAWIDCAGHLPWGLSGDQRLDDARSLTWDLTPPEAPVVGHPRARLRLSVDSPAASLSVKVCDVFPDGTSALVTRGTLDLAFRDGVHGPPVPLEPGVVYTVDVVLDACAYLWAPGQVLRVSVAGADWPNTVAPPAPVTLTVHDGALVLPVLAHDHPQPTFAPGADRSTESAEGISWSIHDDVLARTTTARTRSVSDYATPYDGRAGEDYLGEVTVDRRAFDQTAHAVTTSTSLARRGGAGAVGDGPDPDRRRGRRGHRDPRLARRRGDLPPHLARAAHRPHWRDVTTTESDSHLAAYTNQWAIRGSVSAGRSRRSGARFVLVEPVSARSPSSRPNVGAN